MNMNKFTVLFAIALGFHSVSFADERSSNVEFAESLEGQSFTFTYKYSIFRPAAELQVNIDRDQQISASSNQFPQWGTCSGKLNVTSDSNNSGGKIIMDAGGLFCDGINTLPKYIQLQLSVSEKVLVSNEQKDKVALLNILYNGKWVVSNARGKVDINN